MAVSGRANIPRGFDPKFQPQIEGFLRRALGELQKVDANAKRVTSRLNYSNTEIVVPVWAGTVEHKSVRDLRRFDAGEVRFGQSNRSKVYEAAVMAPQGRIVERDWGQDLAEKSEDGYGPGQALGPRAGCRYQLFIALSTKEGDRFRHIGTLTIGFEQRPNLKAVRPVMEKWATDGSPYVEYVKKTFEPGGPYC
jgi:hypothetical protein